MNLIIILLSILLSIIIYIYYNKNIYKQNNKKVTWATDNNNNDNDTKKEYVFNEKLNSSVTNFLDNIQNSYTSIASNTYPIKASIPQKPEILNNFSSYNITNSSDPNSRVLEYRNQPEIYNSMGVANVYDQLVDNSRLEWGKFTSLDGNEEADYYDINIQPNKFGYTDFATY